MGYSASVLRHTAFFSLLCNGFYYAAFLPAIGGAVQVWRSRERGLLLLAPLYILGLTLAQMLVEVAGRYHYSMIPMLLLLGQGDGVDFFIRPSGFALAAERRFSLST